MTDSREQPVSLPGYVITAGHAPQIERVAWLGAGDFCRCYLINTTHVFRFARHDEASAAIGMECCLLPILEQHLDVAVPHVEFAGRSADTGHALMGYPLLPGTPLDRDALDALPPADRAALITQIADATRQIHAISLERVAGCGLVSVEPLAHLGDVMRRADSELRRHLPDAVWRYHAEMFDRYARDRRLHTYQPALLHGDLSPDHFLADAARARLTAIIDFGDARIGDPAWDLVYVYEDFGADMLAAFLDRYDREHAALLALKARIYQQLNTVEYAMQTRQSGDPAAIDEALALLGDQAGGVEP